MSADNSMRRAGASGGVVAYFYAEVFCRGVWPPARAAAAARLVAWSNTTQGTGRPAAEPLSTAPHNN